MIKRKSFCAFGAYAVNVLDRSQIVVMPLRTAGDLGLPITNTVSIDFTRILDPQTQVEAEFDAAIVDALGVENDGSDKLATSAYPHIDGLNVLTVGPTFPAGPHVGGIFYERTRFYGEVRSVMDPGHDQWPAFDLHTYEIMTTATFDTATNRVARYHGFHAIVRGQQNGKTQLEINTKLVEVDLDDRSVCDDPAAIAVVIRDPDVPSVVPSVLTSASRTNDEGAVFLALTFSAANGLRQGKEPPGGGYAVATTSSDAFARSVFRLSLSRSRRIDIASTDLASIHDELTRTIGKIGHSGENLDIVADAPGGLQVLGTQKLDEILEHDAAAHGGRLARLIRSRFARCRLLGCYTAVSMRARQRMLRLAEVLGIPVVGTMRAISWSDFDKYGFKEFQIIDGVRSTILRSTEQMSPLGALDECTEELLASGWFQEMWLRQFAQVPFELADVSGEPTSRRTVLVAPTLFQREIAATDRITSAPERTVVLETAQTRVPAEVLASATLLRLRSRRHGPVYLNVPLRSPLRQDLLTQLAFG